MDRISKLRPLLRSLEAEVRNAEQEKVRIEEVFEERSAQMTELISRREEIDNEVSRIELEEIPRALTEGARSLQAYSSWLKRIRKEALDIEAMIESKKGGLKSAEARLFQASESLVEMRREKLKVEKLIEDLELKSQILDEVREEVDIESLNNRKK